MKQVAKNSAFLSAARLYDCRQQNIRTYVPLSIRIDSVILEARKLFSISTAVNGWSKLFKYADKPFHVSIDCFKINEGVETSVHYAEPEIRKSFKLPNYCRIFQPEI